MVYNLGRVIEHNMREPKLRELKLKDYEDYLKQQYQTDIVVYGMKITDFVKRNKCGTKEKEVY